MAEVVEAVNPFNWIISGITRLILVFALAWLFFTLAGAIVALLFAWAQSVTPTFTWADIGFQWSMALGSVAWIIPFAIVMVLINGFFMGVQLILGFISTGTVPTEYYLVISQEVIDGIFSLYRDVVLALVNTVSGVEIEDPGMPFS